MGHLLVQSGTKRGPGGSGFAGFKGMHGSRRRVAESEFITHNKREKKEDLCSKSRSKKARVYPNLFLFSQYSCELNNWNLYLFNRLAPGEVVNICYLVTRQWSAWKTLLLGHIGWHKYPLLRTLHATAVSCSMTFCPVTLQNSSATSSGVQQRAQGVDVASKFP